MTLSSFRRAIVLAACLLAVMAGGVAFGKGVDTEAVQERSEAWESGAENRCRAAETQEQQALELLAWAQSLRAREYQCAEEKKGYIGDAGVAEKKAGELAGKASENYEKAAANWIQACGEYRRIRETEKTRNVETLGEEARQSALKAVATAAEAYELAAEAFGPNGSNLPAEAAAASEKAAGWREKLAQQR